MGILNRIFGRTEKRAAGGDYLPQQLGMFGPTGYNDTGVQITEANALICSTVWACVSIIAQTISTLPVHVLKRDGGEKQYDHPLFKLLASSPNEFMTAAVFREAVLTNLLLHGGAYAAVERDNIGHPLAFYPVKSSDVKPIRINGQLLFEVRIGSKQFTLAQDQMVYLLGWTLDGVTPISPVRSAAQSLGLSVAMERYAGRAFSATNVGGILQVPNLSTDAMKAFVASWRANYGGIENAFKTAVLPDPMKFVQTSMDPEKGQLVESRQAQVLEICRIWKVPPSMLGILDKASYASLEMQNMAFYQQTILPWLVKLEQAFSLVGFLESERPELELKFNADGLLRTTTADRYTAHNIAIQGGWKTRNEIRSTESLPPIEGGDVLLQPLSFAAVTASNAPAPAVNSLPAPTPAPAEGTPPSVAEGPADAGVTTSLTLNGAQIAGALDVLDRLAQKSLVGFAAVELLVAVGMSRESAGEMVAKTLAAPSPAPVDPAAAARGLIEATAKRFVTKEQRAIQRAAKKHQGKPDELRAWAETFYRDHAALVIEVMTPVLKAAGITTTAEDVAQRHCSAGLALITRAQADNLSADDMTDLIEDRAANIVDQLFNNRGDEHAAAA